MEIVVTLALCQGVFSTVKLRVYTITDSHSARFLKFYFAKLLDYGFLSFFFFEDSNCSVPSTVVPLTDKFHRVENYESLGKVSTRNFKFPRFPAAINQRRCRVI